LELGSKFCTKCGAAVQEGHAPEQPVPEHPVYPPYEQPTQQTYPPYGHYPPPPPPPKSGGMNSKLKIIIPVACGIVLLAVAVVVYFVFFFGSPAATVARSFSNLNDELEARIQETPLAIYSLLIDALEDGAVTVDFAYSDRWDEVDGTVTLHSNRERGNYILEGVLHTDFWSMDFETYITGEFAAMHIRQVDNEFYGFYFDTFRQDFRSFARLLDLSRNEVDEIADMVDIIHILLNIGDDWNLYEKYEELLNNFISSLEFDSSRIDFEPNGRNIRAQKIEFTITDSMIVELLSDFIDLFEEDDTMRTLFDTIESIANPFSTGRNSFYDEMIRNARDGIRDLRRNLRGEIIVSLYIGSRDRLMRVELDADLEHDRDRAQFEGFWDFGSSAHDTWVQELNMFERGDRVTSTIEWDIRETSRGGETTYRTVNDDRWGVFTTEITLDWTNRGNFALSLRDDWGGNRTLLSGIYTIDNEGFNLVIDDPFADYFWDESLQLQLEISAARGADRIGEIDFVNISDWDMRLLDRLENLFDNGSSNFSRDRDLPPPPPPPPTPIPPVPATPAPTPSPTPGPGGLDESESELLGAWGFSHGSATYFFGQNTLVYFGSDGIGIVIAAQFDEDLWNTWFADDPSGIDIWDALFGVLDADPNAVAGDWFISNNRLIVFDFFGSAQEYTFEFEVVGDTLSITDSDNDTGHFERIR